MMNIHPKAGDQRSKPSLTYIIKSREMVQFASSNITRKHPKFQVTSANIRKNRPKSHPQIIFQFTSPIIKKCRHIQVTNGIKVTCGAIHRRMAMRQPTPCSAAVQALHHQIRTRRDAGRSTGAGKVQKIDLAPGGHRKIGLGPKKIGRLCKIHWIGLRENLNRKPMGFYHQI